MARVVFLQTPDPPMLNVNREYAGGMGVFVSAPPAGSRATTAFPSLSLAQTAAAVERNGHAITLVEAQAFKLDYEQTREAIGDADPDIVVALVSMPSIEQDMELMRSIRAERPATKIIVQGAVCTAMPEKVLGEIGADFATIGEPEAIVPELIDAIAADAPIADVAGVAYLDDGAVARTAVREPVRDIDSLPNVPYELLPIERYGADLLGDDGPAIPVLSSKGCPYACGYCPYPLTVGTRVRMRSPERVMQELRYLARERGVRKVVFRDQVFTMSARHAKELCELMIAEDLGLRWVCETRFDLVKDERMLELMHDAGCKQINFGLESGSPELFASTGKPGATFDVIEGAVQRVRDAGIAVHAHLIIGLPGETWKTVRDTGQLLKRFSIDDIQLSNMIAYPGTPYFEEAKAKGLLLTEEPAKYGGDHVPVRTEALGPVQLLLARVYLRRNLTGWGYTTQLGSMARAGSRRAARAFARAIPTMSRPEPAVVPAPVTAADALDSARADRRRA